MNINKNWYIALLLFSFLAMTFIEVMSALKGYEANTGTRVVWSVISLFAVAFWVTSDSKDYPESKPFEIGFLIYILWPLTLPWYLVATRGIEGLIQTIGFISILFLPWLIGTAVYVYSG